MKCLSVWVRLVGENLLPSPCIRDRGHRGECEDASGRTWVRLGERLRQRREGVS